MAENRGKESLAAGCPGGRQGWNAKNFGERVKKARELAGLTQKKLAEQVGVSGTTIQNYESGQLPSGSQSVSLAKALACSLDWLFLGETPPGQRDAERSGSGSPGRGLEPADPGAAASPVSELEELRRDNRALRQDNHLLRQEHAALRHEVRELQKENRELIKTEAESLRNRLQRDAKPEEGLSKKSA